MVHSNFNDLADALMHGREIEFRYEGKDYSITNSHGEWHFCCDTDGTSVPLCAFPEFELLVARVKKLEIAGTSVEEIFNRQSGGPDLLAVL